MLDLVEWACARYSWKIDYILWQTPAQQIASLWRSYVQANTSNATSTWGDLEFIEQALKELEETKNG